MSRPLAEAVRFLDIQFPTGPLAFLRINLAQLMGDEC